MGGQGCPDLRFGEGATPLLLVLSVLHPGPGRQVGSPSWGLCAGLLTSPAVLNWAGRGLPPSKASPGAGVRYPPGQVNRGSGSGSGRVPPWASVSRLECGGKGALWAVGPPWGQDLTLKRATLRVCTDLSSPISPPGHYPPLRPGPTHPVTVRPFGPAPVAPPTWSLLLAPTPTPTPIPGGVLRCFVSSCAPPGGPSADPLTVSALHRPLDRRTRTTRRWRRTARAGRRA